MRYVDVFISHKLEDLGKAKRLKAVVESWGFTCYLDADDKALQELQDPERLSARIRENLRNCRCLIYAFSSQSKRSKWMPWEIGFFDGRWGQRQIGLFDLDSGNAAETPRSSSDDASSPSALTLQEYLRMYRLVDQRDLESFIRESASTRALADRADVDIDRLSALLAGAFRNPVEFAVGCMQYAVSLQREWAKLVAMPDAALRAFARFEENLGVLRGYTASFEAPKRSHALTDVAVGTTAEVSDKAMRQTY